MTCTLLMCLSAHYNMISCFSTMLKFFDFDTSQPKESSNEKGDIGRNKYYSLTKEREIEMRENFDKDKVSEILKSLFNVEDRIV